jgi:hypothetical protein
MNNGASIYFNKLRHSLPWLIRYPFARASSYLGEKASGQKHIIFTIANHFEPSWKPNGLHHVEVQRRRMDSYYELARKTGDAVRDSDGTKFRHTNFFPGEQYDHEILMKLAAMQREGLGEVEVHLHHGVEEPDTAENLKEVLTGFRDVLAEEHRCLSRIDGKGTPMYAFVHGNLALANSCGGRFCGVDNEMQILRETGCYADMTLPSAPDQSQVPMLNKIYECGLPITEPIPHRKGRNVKAFGHPPQLPLIFTGPLIFHWSEWKTRLLMPRIDDGSLARNQRLNKARLKRWTSANITVEGQPEWIFVKLYCHGFIDHDQSACIGEDAKRFFSEVVETGEKTNDYKVYFATAREACNMVLAAIDGLSGTPHHFRDYRLKTIMDE